MYEYFILLIISYGVIGVGLKYIDEVFDTKKFKPTKIYIISAGIGLLMGSVMSIDMTSLVILFAIIVSVGITGKIDNDAFKLVAILAILLPTISLIFGTNVIIPLLPLMLLAVCGAGDEFLDEIGDKKTVTLFTWRPFMKIMVILLWFFAFFDLVYVLAFFSFDILYSFVGWYSERIKK